MDTSQQRYWLLFENAPVAIWEEDCSGIETFLQEKRAQGLTNFREYFAENPDDLLHCVSLIRVLHVNKTARQFYGASSEAELIRRLPEMFDPGALEVFRDEILAFAEGAPTFQAELSTQTLRNEWRHVRMNVSMPSSTGNNWANVIVTFTDLTDRHRLESSLRDSEIRFRSYAKSLSTTNEKLRRVNQDLEQFAFVAAHGLNEPLRTISLYTQFLQKLCATVDNAKAHDALSYIVESTSRMQDLVTDLLSFAKAIEPITHSSTATANTQQIVAEILADLRAAIDEANADISVGKLPLLRMEESHLRTVLHNLISNAIKYRDKNRPLQVQVDCEGGYGSSVFYVRDNGIGVPVAYRDQIFGLFQRLHGSEVAGTGIGLALAKRIIEHYGGTLWLEPSDEQGSKFCFTAPLS